MRMRQMMLAMAGVAAAWSASAKSPSFAEFDARARAGERLTVVFFGGSLTWSANASDPNRTGFRGVVAKGLEERYPEARFSFVDAAIGGTGSNLGIFRLDRDVLAFRPDLVFVEFACNDGPRDVLNTCCYESILRRLIGGGIPVVQMIFTTRDRVEKGEPYDAPDRHERLAPYRRLAAEYATGLGDVHVDGLLPALDSGAIAKDRKEAMDMVWPLDPVHPGDIGYRCFGEAGIAGYVRAVEKGIVCRVPEKPVYGTVENVRRTDPMSLNPSAPWRRAMTYRTYAWYDGAPSRWMESVAAFSGKESVPLAFEADANFVGVFGEGRGGSLVFEVMCDGRRMARYGSDPGVGAPLFIWRCGPVAGWDKEAPARHSFAVSPVPSKSGGGELHIGAICTARIVPSASPASAVSAASSADMEKSDHARGIGK